jgi:hypothetical protein
MMWAASEIAAIIIGASIPFLRKLFHEGFRLTSSFREEGESGANGHQVNATDISDNYNVPNYRSNADIRAAARSTMPGDDIWDTTVKEGGRKMDVENAPSDIVLGTQKSRTDHTEGNLRSKELTGTSGV